MREGVRILVIVAASSLLHCSSGPGTVRNGYASGEIIQYEIAGDDGSAFMANQADMMKVRY